MFQGSLTTGPSLILAPQVDGTTKEPAVTEKGLFAITVLKISALGGASWTGVVDEGREKKSLGSTVAAPRQESCLSLGWTLGA